MKTESESSSFANRCERPHHGANFVNCYATSFARTEDWGLGTETNYPGAALLGRKLSWAWYLQWENIKLIQDRRYRMQDTTKYKYPPSDASVSVSLGRVGDTFCEESRVADQEFPF